ncbi:serine hydrolase domain-containing protein [Alkalimonas sp. MEB108]|uniref:Serine hydrolase domain-containing protein n=1 Tax=Alkalimonas cellulosilytica TaxID=3058395 RepID=A0ABU7J6R9_9GAMM|nr:serine hydrolase domain-containing protein [Alkalimonas sp. MEB108]MEE2002157.1 serine hydrolase domain-containing protein [Alkalimonas sp. MEB108]
MNRLIILSVLMAICLLPSTWLQAESMRDLQSILMDIKQRSIDTRSDAVLILQGDKQLLSYTSTKSEQPIELMSAYKSIVAMAIGRLLFNEQLTSLDEPVSSFYPEWRQGDKASITVRHLLNHTSGLQDVMNAGEEIYPSPDVIKLALAAELSEPPGSKVRYNNKAVNLLAGIIEKASGTAMDQFLMAEFFEPLGIEQYKFYYDSAGNPHAMAGLELTASDAAKFGLVVANGGSWREQSLIRFEFIEEMLAQSQPYSARLGLLWWRHEYKTTQGDTKLLYYADGYLGQYIVVVPELSLVGVRQLKRTEQPGSNEHAFKDFKELMAQLADYLAQ